MSTAVSQGQLFPEAEILRRLHHMASSPNWDGKCGCSAYAIGKGLHKYNTRDALDTALGAHAYNCRLKQAVPATFSFAQASCGSNQVPPPPEPPALWNSPPIQAPPPPQRRWHAGFEMVAVQPTDFHPQYVNIEGAAADEDVREDVFAIINRCEDKEMLAAIIREILRKLVSM